MEKLKKALLDILEERIKEKLSDEIDSNENFDIRLKYGGIIDISIIKTTYNDGDVSYTTDIDIWWNIGRHLVYSSFNSMKNDIFKYIEEDIEWYFKKVKREMLIDFIDDVRVKYDLRRVYCGHHEMI